MEDWKDIKERAGYQVSNDGKVRSFVNNRHGVGAAPHDIKPVLNKHGYPTVCLGRGRRRLVHRLVAEAFIPNPDNLPLVRHMDDNPMNNNVDNLRWGTQTDNMQDCVRHGRLVGDTRAAVIAREKSVIATSIHNGETHQFRSVQEAARVLGVWSQHISSVLQGKIRQTGGWKFEPGGGDIDE